LNTRIDLTYKVADNEAEFDQIHRLNYRTFAEEIPQHQTNPTKKLVDRFHAVNTYAICLHGEKLVGMLAMNDKRPFSLDQKLPDLERYIPVQSKPVEVRLLAVEPAYRHRRIFPGLLKVLAKLGAEQGWDLALISGVISQLRLYSHIGFIPFGPEVGSNGARFQPMQLTLKTFREKLSRLVPIPRFVPGEKPLFNFLPGPVAISELTKEAFTGEPTSHRSAQFVADFHSLQTHLCKLFNSSHVEIFTGSGTLANDVVAGQLALLGKPGVILVNGEFGERLLDHARRWGLTFKVFRSEWGECFDLQRLERLLKRNNEVGWIWQVHCETSSGILNDLEQMKHICKRHQLKLAIDAMSSLNIVPVDLRGVYLASATSGKGLASIPGLALVFYNHMARPAPKRLPRTLDLGYYARNDGIPFTISSNLVYSLQEAIQQIHQHDYSHRLSIAKKIKEELSLAGFELFGDQNHSSPGVITIRLQDGISSLKVGELLEMEGCWISYRSQYLVRRNLVQVCIMGKQLVASLEKLPLLLKSAIDRIS